MDEWPVPLLEKSHRCSRSEEPSQDRLKPCGCCELCAFLIRAELMTAVGRQPLLWVHLCPLDKDVEALTPTTSEFDFIWK